MPFRRPDQAPFSLGGRAERPWSGNTPREDPRHFALVLDVGVAEMGDQVAFLEERGDNNPNGPEPVE